MAPRSRSQNSSPLNSCSSAGQGHSPLVRWYFFALLRSQLIARWADSFMTSPSWPVRVSWPSPSIRLASTNMISPPKGVQAKPIATPGWLNRSDTLREEKWSVQSTRTKLLSGWLSGPTMCRQSLFLQLKLRFKVFTTSHDLESPLTMYGFLPEEKPNFLFGTDFYLKNMCE